MLAAIAARHRITLYAHYSTNTAGHRGGMAGAVASLKTVDQFLGGYVNAVPKGTVLLLASDHGNVEDVTAGHTRNPALGLVAGPEAERPAGELGSILDIADAVLRWAAERRPS